MTNSVDLDQTACTHDFLVMGLNNPHLLGDFTKFTLELCSYKINKTMSVSMVISSMGYDANAFVGVGYS